MPPPRTKPATPAPISTCCWWRRSCERQSVSCTTSIRASRARSRAPGGCARSRRGSPRGCASASAPARTSTRRTDLLRLVDRHRRLRCAHLELAPGEQEGANGQDQQARTRSGSRATGPEQRVETPGQGQQAEDEREHAEHRARGDRRGPPREARDLLVTSALASSISSRTSTLTSARRPRSPRRRVSGCPLLAGKALEDQGEQEAAGERGTDRDLGAVGGEAAGPPDGVAGGPAGVRPGRRGAGAVTGSGGAPRPADRRPGEPTGAAPAPARGAAAVLDRSARRGRRCGPTSRRPVGAVLRAAAAR